MHREKAGVSQFFLELLPLQRRLILVKRFNPRLCALRLQKTSEHGAHSRRSLALMPALGTEIELVVAWCCINTREHGDYFYRSSEKHQ